MTDRSGSHGGLQMLGMLVGLGAVAAGIWAIIAAVRGIATTITLLLPLLLTGLMFLLFAFAKARADRV